MWIVVGRSSLGSGKWVEEAQGEKGEGEGEGEIGGRDGGRDQ